MLIYWLLWPKVSLRNHFLALNGSELLDQSVRYFNIHDLWFDFLQLNIKNRRAWCYGCNSEVNSAGFVIGETVETFGKALRPKPSDEFVAKPSQESEADSVKRDNSSVTSLNRKHAFWPRSHEIWSSPFAVIVHFFSQRNGRIYPNLNLFRATQNACLRCQ